MKLSKYTIKIELDKDKIMLYNIISRQYYVYEKDRCEQMDDLIQNINSGSYRLDDICIIEELVRKNIVIDNQKDELLELENIENSIRYQDNVFQIMIIVTNACNFRCTYCVQDHENKVMNDISAVRLIKLLEGISKKVRKIKISWFGGEPLLQFERIEEMIYRIKNLCENNYCVLENTMTTNGFLLDALIVDKLQGLNFKNLQITIDGSKESHDSRRFLSNGAGTYKTIIKNLKYVLEKNIQVILRVNIDKDNFKTAEAVLHEFSNSKRELITISLSNIYQEKDKISLFPIYKQAIEMGYQYGGRKNQYTSCQVCYKNGLVVNSAAKIIVCANAMDMGEIGYIDEFGGLHITNQAIYYKIKTISALKNKMCKNCLELPLCIGSCKYYRTKGNEKCIGKRADGLTIEEIAKLDYLYDTIKQEKENGRKESRI